MLLDHNVEFDVDALQLLLEEEPVERVWCRLTCQWSACDTSQILD